MTLKSVTLPVHRSSVEKYKTDLENLLIWKIYLKSSQKLKN